MKRIIAALLLVLLVSSSGYAAEMSNWAVDEVNTAKKNGLLTETILKDDLREKINREEFCGIIVNLYQKLTGNIARSPEILPFEDTDSIPVAKAYSLGIVSGKSNGLFDPYDGVTREEMSKMIVNTLKAADCNLITDDAVLLHYSDRNEISDWAYADMSLMVKYSIITGLSENLISPKTGASREQAVAMINRTYNKFSSGNEKAEDNNYVESVPAFSTDVSLSLNEKEMRVFPDGVYFETKEQADANMIDITIDVWSVDKSGNKYSAKKTLTVNKFLADDIKNIFSEIYNHESQFPVKSIGGYSWRNTAFGKVSQHSYGTCIDINPDENYYCYSEDGSAITGSHWKPYEDIYSITPDGIVVSTFLKYGWVWGGSWNGSVRDYMHFSYLGK